jgi:hypothetical protein
MGMKLRKLEEGILSPDNLTMHFLFQVSPCARLQCAKEFLQHGLVEVSYREEQTNV